MTGSQIGPRQLEFPPNKPLVDSPGKRLVMLSEGTHHMMLEQNRLELFKAVQAFLDEGIS